MSFGPKTEPSSFIQPSGVWKSVGSKVIFAAKRRGVGEGVGVGPDGVLVAMGVGVCVAVGSGVLVGVAVGVGVAGTVDEMPIS